MDSESYINAVSKVIEKVGLENVPHPHSYKVSWINFTTLEVKQRCIVSIDFNLYKDKIWCDVVAVDMGQVILRRLWLFDKDVTIFGRSNMCQLEYEGKKIKLLPSRPKVGQPEKTPITPKQTDGINLISVKAFDQELKKGAPFMTHN